MSCPPLLNLPVFLMTVAVVRVVMMTSRRRLERKEVKTVARAAMLTTPWCSTALSRHKQLTAPGRCNVNTVNTDCNTQLPPELETLFRTVVRGNVSEYYWLQWRWPAGQSSAHSLFPATASVFTCHVQQGNHRSRILTTSNTV